METVRSRDDQLAEEDDEEAEVVAHPPAWRRWAQPAAVAAGLAAALGLAAFVMGETAPSQPELLVDGGRLTPHLGDGWLEPPWSETRGVAGAGADTAFRVGVRVVDLEVALREGRNDDAVELTHELEALLADLSFSEPVQREYSGLRRVIEAGGATPRELVGLARTAEELGREYLPELTDPYELGRWTEVGRLAAESANSRILCSPRFKQTLAGLRASDRWGQEVAAALAEVAELLTVPAADLDFEALDGRFALVLAAG